jgi:hypothetical protein
MKRVVLCLLIGCVCFLPVFAQIVPDTPANRLAAAKRYLKAVPPMEMVSATVDQLASRIPEERRGDFRQALTKIISSEHIEKITLDAITKHFTVKEINALTAFYGSPEGRSITKKFNAYLTDIMPAIQKEMADAMGDGHPDEH